MPIICLISGLLNLAILLILLSLRTNKKMLCLLKWKCLNDMLICVLGSTIGSSMCNYCIDFSRNTLHVHIYRIYFLRYVSEVLTGASVMLEIIITYDRLCLIRGKQSVIVNMKAFFLYCSFLLISLLAYLPDVFVNQLEPLSDGYLRSLTRFGSSIYYNYYYLILVTLLSFLAIVCVTVLNWQTYVVYKRFMANKNRINCVGSKQDTNSTKMIIALNIMFVVPRILFFLGTILPRIDNLKHILYNPITNTYRLVDYDLLLSAFGVNCLIIVYYNKKIKSKILLTLKCIGCRLLTHKT